jgi:hypothetical protein
MKRALFYSLILVCLFSCSDKPSTNSISKPRIVITADPELDDLNSLIRFILYSSDVKVEGLVYASSQFHWTGDGKGTKKLVPGREYTRGGLKICPCESWRWAKDERFIHDVVDAYEKAYPNLKVHNPRYPTPEYLKSKIKWGNIKFDGDISEDSEGSDWIKSLILDDEPGKLFLTAWGGQSTIARALKSIKDQYQNTSEWKSIREKVIDKVVLLPSGDQDDTYRDYIKPNWPEIDYRQFRGGPRYSYGAQLGASKNDSIYLTPAWIKNNISDRGALGAMYRVWGDGKQMVKGDKFDYFGLAGRTNEQLKAEGYVVWMPVQQKGSWLGEGDTGTFMNMLDNGLRGYEDKSYGGWGGRYIPSKNEVDIFQMDSTKRDSVMAAMFYQNKVENDRGDLAFFPAAMNDFATRLKWTVTPKYEDANHEPKIVVDGPANVTAKAGDEVEIYTEITDPDNNSIWVRWWKHPASTYTKEVSLKSANMTAGFVKIPKDAKSGETIHIIIQANDLVDLPLTRYQRVIITVL